jgi:uncharacterized protein (DUF697 family)
MDAKGNIKSGSWFVDLIMSFAPNESNITVTGTPEEMTKTASWESFAISTTAGLVPGPFGWATILPELAALTKLQMNLVYKIAKYHEQELKINKTIVMHIFAGALGVVLGRKLLQKTGTRIIVKALSAQAIRKLAQNIGVKIGSKIIQRGIGRWLFMVTAPIFGAFSKSMTTKIGRVADEFFSQEILVEEMILCSQGHEVPNSSKFCPECGEAMENA